MPQDDEINLHCSFCGQNQNEIEKLIAGPVGVYICDECVDLCNDILAEETEAKITDADRVVPSISSSVRSLVQPQIVSRFANTDITANLTDGHQGVAWMCEGCGWKLRPKTGHFPAIRAFRRNSTRALARPHQKRGSRASTTLS
jgi:hypothetical protein